MPSFAERLKIRVPDWRRFMACAREDRRTMAYDLLPVGPKEWLPVTTGSIPISTACS